MKELVERVGLYRVAALLVGCALADQAQRGLRRAIAGLERNHGDLTAHIDRIHKVEVVYQNKRIDLRFDPRGTPDEFARADRVACRSSRWNGAH